MKLTKTEPMQGGPPTAAISSAPIKSASFDDEDETDNEGALNPISIISLVGAIAALAIALFSFQAVAPANQQMNLTSQEAKNDWKNNPKSDWKIPVEYNPFHKKSGESWTPIYASKKAEEHAIPSRE